MNRLPDAMVVVDPQARAHRRQGSAAHGRGHGGPDRHRQRPRRGRSAHSRQRRQHPLHRIDPGRSWPTRCWKARPRCPPEQAAQARPRPTSPRQRHRREPQTRRRSLSDISHCSVSRRAPGYAARWLNRQRLYSRGDQPWPITAAAVKTLRDRTNAADDEVQGRPHRSRRRHGEGHRDAAQEDRRTSRPSAATARPPRAGSASTSIPPRRSAPSSRCAARPPRSPRASCSSSSPTIWPSRSPCKNPANVEALLAQPFVDDSEQDGQRAHQRRDRPDPREHEAGTLRPR